MDYTKAGKQLLRQGRTMAEAVGAVRAMRERDERMAKAPRGDIAAQLEAGGMDAARAKRYADARSVSDGSYEGGLRERLAADGKSPADVDRLISARPAEDVGGEGRTQEVRRGRVQEGLADFAPEPNGAGDHRIIIARAGLSADGRKFYPGDVLKRAAEAGLLDGARMHVNHEPVTAQARRGHRDMSEFVGTILPGTVTFTGDVLTGVAHVHDPRIGEWLDDPISRQQIGLSADWNITWRDGFYQGKTVEMVEGIETVYSIDLVPSPNLGGKVL